MVLELPAWVRISKRKTHESEALFVWIGEKPGMNASRFIRSTAVERQGQFEIGNHEIQHMHPALKVQMIS
jgi:hypothetical protein